MANTVVILIRVFLGMALGFVGLIVFGQGFIMIAHVDFPTWGLTLAMLAGMAAGSSVSIAQGQMSALPTVQFAFCPKR